MINPQGRSTILTCPVRVRRRLFPTALISRIALPLHRRTMPLETTTTAHPRRVRSIRVDPTSRTIIRHSDLGRINTPISRITTSKRDRTSIQAGLISNKIHRRPLQVETIRVLYPRSRNFPMVSSTLNLALLFHLCNHRSTQHRHIMFNFSSKISRKGRRSVDLAGRRSSLSCP